MATEKITDLPIESNDNSRAREIVFTYRLDSTNPPLVRRCPTDSLKANFYTHGYNFPAAFVPVNSNAFASESVTFSATLPGSNGALLINYYTKANSSILFLCCEILSVVTYSTWRITMQSSKAELLESSATIQTDLSVQIVPAFPGSAIRMRNTNATVGNTMQIVGYLL